MQVQLGLEAHDNVESLRRTMRGFKIANAQLRKDIFAAMKKGADLETRRAKIPARVPVKNVVEGKVIKLATECKHLTDLLKMVAYQAEGDLLRMIAPDYQRVDEEGRTLIQSALFTSGDIEVDGDMLHVRLLPLSSPHRTRVLAALCEQLNDTKTRFPGSGLRLHVALKPEPRPASPFRGRDPPPSPRPNRTLPSRGRSGGLESQPACAREAARDGSGEERSPGEDQPGSEAQRDRAG